MNTNCVDQVLGVEMGVEGIGKMEHVFAKVFWFKHVRVILPVESALFSPFFDGAFPSIIPINFHGSLLGPWIESTTSLHSWVEFPDLEKKNVSVLCKKIKFNWVFSFIW